MTTISSDSLEDLQEFIDERFHDCCSTSQVPVNSTSPAPVNSTSQEPVKSTSQMEDSNGVPMEVPSMSRKQRLSLTRSKLGDVDPEAETQKDPNTPQHCRPDKRRKIISPICEVCNDVAAGSPRTCDSLPDIPDLTCLPEDVRIGLTKWMMGFNDRIQGTVDERMEERTLLIKAEMKAEIIYHIESAVNKTDVCVSPGQPEQGSRRVKERK